MHRVRVVKKAEDTAPGSTDAPAMTDFDRDRLALIGTGGWVKCDTDRGTVEITQRGDRTPARA